MKVYANKDDFEWFKEMHSEGKTRPMTITTFKESLDDIEISLSRPSKTSPKIEGQLQHGVNTGELKTCEDYDSIKGSPQKKHAPRNGQPIRVSGVKYDDIIVEDETADAYKKVQWPIKKQSPEKICSGCRAHFIDGKCPDTNCGCVYHKENEVC